MEARKMKSSFRALGCVWLSLLVGLSCLIQAQTNLSLKDIVMKNIQASGGKEKISQFRNFCFKAGLATYHVSSDGKMKITSGKEPVITEVILIHPDRVQRNSFNEITDVGGLDKTVYQCLAKLYSGLWTLANFEKQLSYEGVKAFGPEKLHLLSTKTEGIKINFYLDSLEYRMKRILFQGYLPDGQKYEVNYDFGPYQEFEGLELPTSWFCSQVGARGTLFEITDMKLNQLLEADFFSKLEVNAGQVEVAESFLKGNVIEFRVVPNSLYIITNWTKKLIEKAGFKTKDHLIVSLDGVEKELIFYASANELPSQSTFVEGAQIMTFDARAGETYVIQFYATDFSQISEKLAPLLPIQIKRK
jgi:hypothetical protein